MEKIQIFSLILLFVMLFSVVATAVYFAGGSDENQESDDITLIGDIKGFKADGIPATVQNILPVLVVQGRAKSPNITILEEKLRGPNKVIQLFSSGFLDNSATPMYIGILKLKSADDIMSVATELSETLPEALDDLAFFKKGIASISDPIELTQLDDESVTQNVVIPNIESFLFMNTNEKSEITLSCSLQINLNTEEVSQPLCSEEAPEDIVEQPEGFQIIGFTTTGEITDLNNTITFSHKVNYNNLIDTEAITADFEALSLITGVELLNYTEPIPKLIANANFDDNSVADALDLAIPQINGVTTILFDYTNGRYTAEIDFDPATDLNTIKGDIETAFTDNSLEVNINDKETKKELNVYLHFDSDDAQAVANSTESVFTKYGMDFDLARIGYADLPSEILYDGITYTLEDNENIGLVITLDRKIGDTIDVGFFGITDGTKISSKALVKDKALN